MGVLGRHADLRVTEDLHHNPLVHTLSEQESGRGMPRIVNPRVPDASGFEQCLPLVPVGVVADRTAVRLAPYEIAIFPNRTGSHPLFELRGPMRPKCHHQWRGKRDGAPTLVRFQFGELQPAASSLGA